MNIIRSFFPDLSDFIPQNVNLSAARQNTASIFAFLTAIVVLNNIVILTPNLGVLYYAVLGIILLLVLCCAGRIRINTGMLLIYLACIASLLLNDVPVFFKAEYRLVTFIVVSLLISPAISSNFLAFFRLKLFQNLLYGMVLLVLLSFFGRFVGISSSIANYWCGILNHPMTLGSVSGMVAITVFNDLNTPLKSGRASKFLIVSLIIAVLCMLGASSRAALGATILGIFIVLLSSGNSTSNLFKWGILGVICALLTVSLWTPLWQQVVDKNQGTEAISISSRETHWTQRFEEFKSNPVFGIGFGTVDDDTQIGSTFNLSSGQIETGSSWLSILSMTGLFGMAAFLLLINNTIYRYKQIKNRRTASLLFGLLVFVFVEMVAEGMIFAAGSFLFFIIWSLFGAFEAVVACEQAEGKFTQVAVEKQ